ncbi:MAG: 3-dehydroquinate synthase [Planctomycetes bacterium]|nr:3-dehydroquinate synthase [Planctomycetota bacterium]
MNKITTKLSFANSKLKDYCARNIKRLRPQVKLVVVVYDACLPESLMRQVVNGVKASGCQVKLIKAPRGEKNKTMARATQLAEKFLRAKVDRGSLVLAVGGGVTSDVAGFSAAMTLRGIRWACLPTTLLAMVDAGIGGKTGVNTDGAKNMFGAFHFPEFIHCDFRWLKSLPLREFNSGLGELQKTALLAGGKLLSLCLAATPSQLHRPSPQLRQAVILAAKYKAKLVASDPQESNSRKVLNFGHTFGHPLEMDSDSRLSHGEAVSYGIRCAIAHSADLGLCGDNLVQLNSELQRRLGLDYLSEIKIPSASTLRRGLAKDKKSIDGKLTLVLLEKAGRPQLCAGYSAAEVAKIIIANQ